MSAPREPSGRHSSQLLRSARRHLLVEHPTGAVKRREREKLRLGALTLIEQARSLTLALARIESSSDNGGTG